MNNNLLRAAAAYGSAAETGDKGANIVLLYDGAILRLGDAKLAIAEKRIEDRFNRLESARRIIEGLHGCLDFDAGGEVAATLHRFYTYVQGRILQIHMNQSLESCDELISNLTLMRNAWAEAASQGQRPAPQPAAARADTRATARAISA